MKNKIILVAAVCLIGSLCSIGNTNNDEATQNIAGPSKNDNNSSQNMANKFCDGAENEHFLLCKLEDGITLESGMSLAWFLSHCISHHIEFYIKHETCTLFKNFDFYSATITFEKYIDHHVFSDGGSKDYPTLEAFFAKPAQNTEYDKCPLVGIAMRRDVPWQMVAEKLLQRFQNLQSKGRIMENANIEIELIDPRGYGKSTFIYIVDKKLANKYSKFRSNEERAEEIKRETKKKKKAQKELDF